jgi:hypothetical protein
MPRTLDDSARSKLCKLNVGVGYMELRYKKKPVLHHILFLLAMVIFIYGFATSVMLEGFTYSRLLGACLASLYAISLWLQRVKYYKMIQHDVVMIDEKEISLSRDDIITRIPWTEVKKVEWGKSKGDHQFSIIRIISETKVIGIGRNIEGLGSITQLAKAQAGNRFNTRDVPTYLLSYK